MTSNIFRSSLFLLILVAAQPVRVGSAQASQEKPNSSPYYSPLTQGMIASPVFPYEFQSTKLRLEIRNLIVGHAKANQVPTPTDILMELRGGIVTTTINGQSQERIQGDFWTVEKGASLAIENQGQAAVIRAVYLYPRAK
jgi:hypothetical protein